MLFRIIAATTLMFTLTTGALAKLEPGDKAPALDPETWLKRKGGFEPEMRTEGRVQIVLFWSTKDSSSNDAFAKMVELLQSSPPERLVVFGVSQEDEGAVRDFCKRNPNGYKFAIAAGKSRKGNRDWLDGAKGKDLPIAFIVGSDGIVKYFGSPLEPRFSDVLSRVLRGRYNPKYAAQGDEKWEAAKRARKIKNWTTATKLYNEVIDLDRGAYSDVVLEKFELMLVDMGQADQAYAYATAMMQEYSATDPQFLADLARKIATDPKIPDASRRMDVALQAAQLMVTSVADNDKPEALATLALVHFRNKDVNQAVELQKEAWFTATPAYKPQFKQVLDGYVAAQQRQGTAQGAAQGAQKSAPPGGNEQQP